MTSATPPPPPPPPAGDGARSRARADLIWYLRHADALARWPVLPERWAQRLERRRLHPEGDGRAAGTGGAPRS